MEQLLERAVNAGTGAGGMVGGAPTRAVLVATQASVEDELAASALTRQLRSFGVAEFSVLGPHDSARRLAAVVRDAVRGPGGAHGPASGESAEPRPDAPIELAIHAREPGADLGALSSVLRRAVERGEAVIVADAGLVCSDSPLGDVCADPRVSTAALVRAAAHATAAGAGAAGTGAGGAGAGGAGAGAGSADVRTAGAVITSIGTVLHAVSRPDARLVGILRIGVADVDHAARAAGRLSELAAERRALPDLLRLTLLSLVRGGCDVRAVPVGPFVAALTPHDGPAVEHLALAAALDEPSLRGRIAARADDGFYSTFVLRRLSRRVTAYGLARGWRPNAVTVASAVVGALAAAAFAAGAWPATLLGAVLLQVCLLLDCVDGEIARFTRGYTPLGAWLDAISDRVKEYLVYAGLAVGATRSGAAANLIWTLAAATLAVQVFRHVVDLGFWVGRSAVTSAAVRPTVLPLDQTDDRPRHLPADAGLPWADSPLPSAGAPGRRAPAAGRSGVSRDNLAASLSERTNRWAPVKWAKRILIMPIGERWLVISLGSVLVGAIGTFATLLALGAVASAYTTAGRVMRSVGGPPPDATLPVAGDGATLPAAGAASGAAADAAAGRARFGSAPLEVMADAGVLSRLVGAGSALMGRRVPSAATVLAGAAVVGAGLATLSPGDGVRPLLLAASFAVLAGVALARPLTGRTAWIVPALVRAVEYGFVIVSIAVLAPQAMPAAFALLAVAAYHHYDTVYRLRQIGVGPAPWLPVLALGADGRMLAVGLLLLVAEPAMVGVGLGWLTVALALVIVAESLSGWLRWLRSQRDQRDGGARSAARAKRAESGLGMSIVSAAAPRVDAATSGSGAAGDSSAPRPHMQGRLAGRPARTGRTS